MTRLLKNPGPGEYGNSTKPRWRGNRAAGMVADRFDGCIFDVRVRHLKIHQFRSQQNYNVRVLHSRHLLNLFSRQIEQGRRNLQRVSIRRRFDKCVEDPPVVLYRKKACPNDNRPVRKGGLRGYPQKLLCPRRKAVDIVKEMNPRGINVCLGGSLLFAVPMNEINEAVKRCRVVQKRIYGIVHSSRMPRGAEVLGCSKFQSACFSSRTNKSISRFALSFLAGSSMRGVRSSLIFRLASSQSRSDQT